MTAGEAILTTPRLTLRSWRETDRDAFAALNADPEVMRDLGGPFIRADSDAKFDRYRATFRQHGFSRLAIEERQGLFVGYAGIMPARLTIHSVLMSRSAGALRAPLGAKATRPRQPEPYCAMPLNA